MLGAIGIPPGQSAVSQGLDDSQPISANRLRAIAREEKTTANETGKRLLLKDGHSIMLSA